MDWLNSLSIFELIVIAFLIWLIAFVQIMKFVYVSKDESETKKDIEEYEASKKKEM